MIFSFKKLTSLLSYISDVSVVKCHNLVTIIVIVRYNLKHVLELSRIILYYI